MPKITLTPDNKVQQNDRYPTLSLDYDERALINCIEKDPTKEFRHILKKPIIGPDGNVQKIEKKNSKNEPYLTDDLEFVSQHLCFGDFSVVSDKGSDPVNCPTCAAYKNQHGIAGPTPHYAMHVIRYALQQGSFELRNPLGVELLAWTFSATRLNTLIELATDLENSEVEGDNLQKHDLRLGPCQSKQFQKYEIHVVPSLAQWLRDEDRKKLVVETYQNNQAEDLAELIARRISKADAEAAINEVLTRYDELSRSHVVSVPELSGQPSSSGMDVFKSTEELNTTAGQPAPEAAAVDSAVGIPDLADLMKEL